ncbi:MAG: hypothetical protein LBR27_10675 [Bifidobacteriaceae bacterium]|jgi:hypothetical protein|nr:hypothetical protein [Bifidobacteriaceae bacterium]
MVSPRQVSPQSVVKAVMQVDPSLAVEEGRPGAMMVAAARGHVVLHIAPSTLANCQADIARLLPGYRPAPHDGTTWWTEAWAPWGPWGEAGVAVALSLAATLDGTCLVEDGH